MTGIIDPLERPCCFLAAATPPWPLNRVAECNSARCSHRFASAPPENCRPTTAVAFPSAASCVHIRDRGRIRASTTTTTTFFQREGRGERDKKEGKYRVVVKLNGMRRCNFYTRYADRAIKNFIPRWIYGWPNGSWFIGSFYRNTFCLDKKLASASTA